MPSLFRKGAFFTCNRYQRLYVCVVNANSIAWGHCKKFHKGLDSLLC
jgi:hypothetical protein